MWSFLRRRQLGVPIRRQHPVGPVVFDFSCPAAKVAVEIDGDHHDAMHDELRDAELFAQHRILVLRFDNSEVRDDIFEVLAELREAITRRVRSRGPSSPSPAAGEGARG